jgi:hypothetical protein
LCLTWHDVTLSSFFSLLYMFHLLLCSILTWHDMTIIHLYLHSFIHVLTWHIIHIYFHSFIQLTDMTVFLYPYFIYFTYIFTSYFLFLISDEGNIAFIFIRIFLPFYDKIFCQSSFRFISLYIIFSISYFHTYFISPSCSYFLFFIFNLFWHWHIYSVSYISSFTFSFDLSFFFFLVFVFDNGQN